jgi:hypothetical protein
MRLRCTWVVLLNFLIVLPALADDSTDKRSIEIIRYDCVTDTTRREFTMFANGTLRLREGQIGNEWMGLTELGPDDLQGYLNRLAGEDLSESQSPERGVEGAWIERCELRLQLSGQPLKTYRFGHYDPLSLNLTRVVQITQELVEKVSVTKEKDELPTDYEPQIGDLLKRAGDGALFRIIAFTGDSKGVELQGVELPLEMYMPKEEVRNQFTVLVSRRK